jgi:hypothetical protein
MSYSIHWLVPERILYVHVPADVPMTAWGAIQTEILAQIALGKAPVHQIIDTELSPNVTTIKDIKGVSGLRPVNHPKMGWVMILQHNVVVRFFATVALQLFTPQVKYEMVSDYSHAIEALKHRDDSLKALDLPMTKPHVATNGDTA